MSAGEPSKLLSYVSLLYDRMDSEASEENNVRVWRGRVIATCRELEIPYGSYAKVQSKLRSMGCIEFVSRGYRGSTLTTYILHYPPTPERFAEDSAAPDLTNAPTPDRLSAEMSDLRKQLGGVNIVEAFADIEQRLARLERLTRNLEE